MFSVSDFRQMFGLQRCIATVNGSCITFREYRYELLRIPNLPEDRELLNLFKRQVVDSLILREALYQEALKLGIVVSNREIVDTIKNDASFYEGNEFSFEKYRDILERAGLTPQEYENILKKVLTVRKLFKLIEFGVYISEGELEVQKKIYAFRAKGVAYLVTPQHVSIEVVPSEEEMKRYYERNKGSFVKKTPKLYRLWKTRSKEEAHRIYSLLKKGQIPDGGQTLEEQEVERLYKDAVKAIRSLDMENRVSITKSEGIYYIAYLERMSSERLKEFEEVKEEIKQLLLEEKKGEFLEKKAYEVKENLLKGRTPSVQGVQFDSSKIEEFIALFSIKEKDILELVFSDRKVFGPYSLPEGYTVLFISDKDYEELKDEDIKRLKEELLKVKVDSLAQAYAQRVLDGAEVKINQEFFRRR